MKKIYMLTALLALAFIVNAQNYRKWDFTNWSAQTVANLQADAAASATEGWSDIEKRADAALPGAVAPETTANKCFWHDGAAEGELTANGTPIVELAGLYFGASYCANRSLAIAVDYPSTSLGEYAGPQYLWLGGGNKSAGSRLLCFTIPKVAIGQKMQFVVESHKPSDARGISLFVNDVNVDANLIVSWKPTAQETFTLEEGWTLPEGVTDEDGDGLVDILVYNTNGCHLYSIEVGDNTQKSKVAFLYNGSADADLAYAQLKTSDTYEVEAIEATASLTQDVLTAYDVVVISSTVTNADAIAALKTIQPFVPVLNLNPAIYAAWGFGAVGTDGQQFAQVSNPAHALFRGLTIIDGEGTEGETIYGLQITNNIEFKGVTLSGYFANDLVLGTVMGSEDVAIHAHNLDHNGYLFVPYTQETLADAATPALLNNAVSVLAGSKAKITQAVKPTFKLTYKDMRTLVAINSTVTGAQIFYTLDGSEPTEQSKVYTEPIEVTTEGVTVKAKVLGDGYLLSDMAEVTVDLRHQIGQPTIDVAYEDGVGKVTITPPAITGVDVNVYYNYSGSAEATQSTLAGSEPIIIRKAKTIYAFTVAEDYVNSEVASLKVEPKEPKVRLDVLSHMDANSAEYNGGSTSTAYYFSWGKDKALYPYYNLDSRQETEEGTDPETGDPIVIISYTELSPEEEKDFETGWAVRSRGQIVDWENLTTGSNFGDSNGYNYASVDDVNEDFPVTKALINIADKNTTPSDVTFPYNAYITTTAKFKGPFDIVANMASVTKPDAAAKHLVVLQVATDGNTAEANWQTVGDTIDIDNKARLTHNVIRSYEGTDEVYVRAYLCANNSKVGFYDIYIANAGEKTQEYLSGIQETAPVVKNNIPAGIYNANGVRQNALQRGLNIVRYSDGTTRKVMVK